MGSRGNAPYNLTLLHEPVSTLKPYQHLMQKYYVHQILAPRTLQNHMPNFNSMYTPKMSIINKTIMKAHTSVPRIHNVPRR